MELPYPPRADPNPHPEDALKPPAGTITTGPGGKSQQEVSPGLVLHLVPRGKGSRARMRVSDG